MLSTLTLLCATAKKGSNELKVMSYNIRHGYVEKSDTGLKHWDNRKFASVNMINSEKPDIIGFQEMRAAQQEYLAGELPQY